MDSESKLLKKTSMLVHTVKMPPTRRKRASVDDEPCSSAARPKSPKSKLIVKMQFKRVSKTSPMGVCTRSADHTLNTEALSRKTLYRRQLKLENPGCYGLLKKNDAKRKMEQYVPIASYSKHRKEMQRVKYCNAKKKQQQNKKC